MIHNCNLMYSYNYTSVYSNFWINDDDILDFKYKFSVNDKADFLT